MARAAVSRLEFRIRPEAKQRIQRAADLVAVPVGDFVRSAAEARAEEVIQSHAATVVPADFFDALLEALDRPVQPSPALERAARRRAALVTSR
jgi:uncharacterized protein (DUF1778 family)